MTPASFDTTTVFSTDEGVIEQRPDGTLNLTCGSLDWSLSRKEVGAVHRAVRRLAQTVQRCSCEGRWQLRVRDWSAVVLSTKEVISLHELVEGADVMLELSELLSDLDIDGSAS